MNCSRNLTILAAGIVMVFAAQSVPAQSRADFEEYAARERQAFANFKAERQAEFNRYREQYNRDFIKYLSEEWKRITPNRQITPPQKPKPFVPKPNADDSKAVPEAPVEMPVQSIVTPKAVQPASEPIMISRPKKDSSQKTIRIESFYGNNFTLRCSNKVEISHKINGLSDIASIWKKLTAQEFEPLVYDCQQAREKYHFCDWMYYLFIQKVARAVTQTTESSDAETILTAYILAQSGIDFRFVHSDQRLLLALPFSTQVYGLRYFKSDNRDFYIIGNDHTSSCQIMDRSFCKEASPLNLRISTPQRQPHTKSGSKTLTSKKYPEIRVTITNDKALMDFYSSYPHMGWQEYSLAPLSEANTESIMKAFSPILKNKSEEDAVNMILNFVQTAFSYGYDNEIWGCDRPFFADETLYYPQSDCEDRSILFSYLIRQLTNLDVVLLHYPSHLATAVRLNTNLPGAYVLVNGHKYFVCDPTGYKPIGYAYDEFKNVEAKVIKIQ